MDGEINASGAKSGMLSEIQVNTIAADALLPWVTRSSAAVVLAM